MNKLFNVSLEVTRICDVSGWPYDCKRFLDGIYFKLSCPKYLYYKLLSRVHQFFFNSGAIMRKLAHIIFGILKSGKMYYPNYKPALA